MSNEQTQQADDPSGPDNQLANRIRAAMLASGLTRYQLSQQTGIAQSVLGRFASGERDLTLNTTSRLVPTLGLDLMATDTSDSEPETMEQLRKRLAVAVRQNVELADELEDVRRSKTAHQRIAKASVERAQEAEALLAEVERGGEQVNAELQQLREQVATSQHLAEMSRRQVEDEAGKIEQLKEQMQTLTQERDRYRNQLAGAIEHSGAPEAQAQLVDRLQKWLRPVLELVAEHPEDASPLAVAVLGFLPGIASRLIEE